MINQVHQREQCLQWIIHESVAKHVSSGEKVTDLCVQGQAGMLLAADYLGCCGSEVEHLYAEWLGGSQALQLTNVRFLPAVPHAADGL